jgi:DNA invertase Pin-like site-specific DNA recombinase
MAEFRGNAIIAARLSRKRRNSEYGNGLGIDTQDECSREFAAYDGWNVVAVVADTKSGTVPPWDRKNLRDWVTQPDKLVLYDAIIAYKTDRVSRGDQEDFTRIEHWATAHGKRIVIVDGPQYPARDDSDHWRWQAEKRLARQEWEQIRERNSRYQKALIARGKLVGKPPWGYEIAGEYKDKTLVPNELGRTWVPLIFGHCAEGWSLSQIAAWLDAEDVPTANGDKWSPATLTNMMRRTTYVGYRRDGNGQIILKCEPLIDIDLFNRAQAALASRPKRGPMVAENRSMCTSVLFCAHCFDSPMYRIYQRSGHGNSKNWYYRCTGRGTQRKGCGNMIRLEAIDKLVGEAMERLVRPITMLKFIPGNDHSGELKDTEFLLQHLSSQQLSDEEEDAERARLRAERDRIKALPIEPGHTERVETGETYADRWASLSADVERNDWLRSIGVRVWAWKYDGGDLDPEMHDAVRSSLEHHPTVQSLAKSYADGAYHLTRWDGSIVVNVVIPLAGLRRAAFPRTAPPITLPMPDSIAFGAEMPLIRHRTSRRRYQKHGGGYSARCPYDHRAARRVDALLALLVRVSLVHARGSPSSGPNLHGIPALGNRIHVPRRGVYVRQQQ